MHISSGAETQLNCHFSIRFKCISVRCARELFFLLSRSVIVLPFNFPVFLCDFNEICNKTKHKKLFGTNNEDLIHSSTVSPLPQLSIEHKNSFDGSQRGKKNVTKPQNSKPCTYRSIQPPFSLSNGGKINSNCIRMFKGGN